MRHLLSIEDLDRAAIERILDRAKTFTEVSEREIKKVPALRGRRVLNLFYEASTRTRSSFELAAKSLSADVINFAASGSSVEKGESLKDTVQTMSAYRPDLIVIRTPYVGAAQLVAGWTTASVVNAGDGKHEHPTQALLDVYTLRERLGSLDGAEHLDRRRHHCTAASPARASSPSQKMGAKVTVCGPPTLIPRGMEALCDVRLRPRRTSSEADVVYALRMQNERMNDSFVPSLREYAAVYQINGRRLGARQVLMHPGPVNRGVELSAEVIDSPQAVIGQQVEAGVVVRMAVLYELLDRARRAAARPRQPPRCLPNFMLDHRPIIPADVLIKGAHVLDPRTGHRRAARRPHRATARSPRSAPTCASTARSSTATGRHLFPGFVDPHVHLRVPGQEHKEDLETGTRSAAAGGFVAIVAHAEHEPDRRLRPDPALPARAGPPRRPHPRRLPRQHHRRPRRRVADRDGRAARVRRARLHRRRQARPPRRHPAQGAAVPEARAAGSSPCTRRTRRSPASGVMHEGEVSARLGLAGIPSISESTLIARDAAIARYEDGRIHIQHLSARESVEAIAEAKARGVQITCEASPHHLTLTDEALLEKLDTRLKMNPPLRTEDDRQALIEGLKDGTIDCIATDHAPHAREEKEVPFEEAPMGTTGLETAFAAVYTAEASCRSRSIVEKLSAGAALMDLPTPEIAVGRPPTSC